MSNGELASMMVDVIPSEFMILLQVCIEAGDPFLVTGEPGIGKTTMMKHVVTDILGYDLIIAHPATDDPTDWKGFPFIIDNLAEFLPYGLLRKIQEAKKPLVVFFDDFGQSPNLVQAAIMQVFGGREINGVEISKHVRFIFATNRKGDRAGVGGLLEPVKSRCVTIVNLVADLAEWSQWHLAGGGHDSIPSYFHWKPDHMTAFKPTSEIVNTPTLRGWENVGKIHKYKLADRDLVDLETKAFCGAVGAEAGNGYAGFLKRRRHLTDPRLMLANPDTYNVPPHYEIDTLWALGGAISAIVERKTMDNFVIAINRLPADFMVMSMNMAVTRESDLKNTGAYAEWQCQHQDVLLWQ